MSSRRPVARASANCKCPQKPGRGSSRLRPDPCPPDRPVRYLAALFTRPSHDMVPQRADYTVRILKPAL
jgi:hypothetical protein